MRSLQIVLFSLSAAVLCGVVHNQITARLGADFSFFHLPIFRVSSPNLMGLGWDVLATGWVVLRARSLLAARAGSHLKRPGPVRLGPFSIRLAVIVGGAFLSGLSGYLLARNGVAAPPKWVLSSLTLSTPARLATAWWARGASYGAGLIRGVVLCLSEYRRGRSL